ncbi:MAG: hypothetical protein ACRELT_07625 [Longimicrobiales bacterium]
MRRLGLVIVLILAACADEIPEDVSAEMEAARAASREAADTPATAPQPDDLLVTAPAGGHVTWIRDIDAGLDSVPAQAVIDRGEALHAVQELYSRRFEPLRRFYGPGGVLDAGPAMSQSVERAGTRLQQLMQHLANDAADADLIEQSVRASQDALQQVENASRAAGLDPAAPRDVITTGS